MDSASSSAESQEPQEKPKTFAEKQAERMKRLKQLHTQRNEARTHNHQEVIAEDARNNLPANWENRKRRAEWQLNDQKARQEAAERGEDYDRTKLLNTSATDAERFERKKKKKNPDMGFSDFEAATKRQYDRLIKTMAPKDMERYEEMKEKYGDAFYGGRNVIIHGLHEDRKDAVDNMVKDLEDQIASVINIQEEELIMMMLTLIILMKGMLSLIRSWRDFTVNILRRSSKIWNEELQFKVQI